MCNRKCEFLLLSVQPQVTFIVDWNVTHLVYRRIKVNCSYMTTPNPIEFKWLVKQLLYLDRLSYLPYSQDIMPSDLQLFLSLSQYVLDKKCLDEEHLKTQLIKFFNQKSKGLYKEWSLFWQQSSRQVTENDGTWIIENY